MLIQGFLYSTHPRLPIDHLRTVCGVIGCISHPDHIPDTQTHITQHNHALKIRKWRRWAYSCEWVSWWVPTIILVQRNRPGVAIVCSYPALLIYYISNVTSKKISESVPPPRNRNGVSYYGGASAGKRAIPGLKCVSFGHFRV